MIPRYTSSANSLTCSLAEVRIWEINPIHWQVGRLCITPSEPPAAYFKVQFKKRGVIFISFESLTHKWNQLLKSGFFQERLLTQVKLFLSNDKLILLHLDLKFAFVFTKDINRVICLGIFQSNVHMNTRVLVFPRRILHCKLILCSHTALWYWYFVAHQANKDALF